VQVDDAATTGPRVGSGLKRVVVLGSTGSIGTNCLDVIASLDGRLRAVGLSAHASWQELFAQAVRHRPRWGSLLAAGDGSGNVRLWDVGAGSERGTLKGDPNAVNSLAFTPDGRTVAAGNGTGSVWLWDTAIGNLQTTFPGHWPAIVTSLAFSTDGKVLASAGTDGTVKLWDAGTGKERGRFTHAPWITAVTFPAKDKLLIASGSKDGTVNLWKVDLPAD
jgi:WD40 repeat protein